MASSTFWRCDNLNGYQNRVKNDCQICSDCSWEGTMNLARRTFLHLAAGAAALPFAPHVARARAYPTRPITMVVPYPPGGATDVIGRSVGGRMRAALGQPVIIENVTGAGGTIATGRVVRATPDGYTLSIGQNETHVVNGATYTLQYDVLNDFERWRCFRPPRFYSWAKKRSQRGT
jgi:tripartite-type tricarboxylate transporter receptor subunit TctC